MDEVQEEVLYKIVKVSFSYVQSEHLPLFKLSNWETDYLYGLQNQALEQLMNK